MEGDAEQILLPVLVKKILGVSLDEIGISLINIGSTGFANVAKLFHSDRVRRNCSILTDNDISIVKLPDDSSVDSEYDKGCRNSELSGIERKGKLDVFCMNNIWTAPFYAKHTFEVDFLLANNSYEIVKTIKKEYEREGDIKRIQKLLEDEDVAIAGKEILRLAEKFGKGWFAIMVSENINNITGIPEYILNDGILHSNRLYNQEVK